MVTGQQSEAERILFDCVTQYYVSSGLVRVDDQDGYGPLREARVFLESNGCDGIKAALAKWKRS